VYQELRLNWTLPSVDGRHLAHCLIFYGDNNVLLRNLVNVSLRNLVRMHPDRLLITADSGVPAETSLSKSFVSWSQP
jgi:hypothetical protein